jgi:hypothetical protein
MISHLKGKRKAEFDRQDVLSERLVVTNVLKIYQYLIGTNPMSCMGHMISVRNFNSLILFV